MRKKRMQQIATTIKTTLIVTKTKKRPTATETAKRNSTARLP